METFAGVAGTQELRVRAQVLRESGPELVDRFMAELREVQLGVPLPDRERPRASDEVRRTYDAAIALP